MTDTNPPDTGSRPVIEAASAQQAETVDLESGLVRRAQRGDTDAFETLYRRNAGRVYALCLRMTADAARAEELTQDAFLRAWERLGSFRGESRFSTWLHGLTVNLVLGDRRTRSRRPRTTGDAVTLERTPGSPAGAVQGERRDLERAIAALPDGARTVFVLHDIEGYRHDEIAAFTGVTAGTSKAQLHRARRLLREALGS